MNKRNNILPAVFAAASFLLLAGCTCMNGGKAAAPAAPVPPPPSQATGTTPQGNQPVKTPKEDLPDRLFAPLDDTVNDLNHDINRDIDSESPPNKSD